MLITYTVNHGIDKHPVASLIRAMSLFLLQHWASLSWGPHANGLIQHGFCFLVGTETNYIYIFLVNEWR